MPVLFEASPSARKEPTKKTRSDRKFNSSPLSSFVLRPSDIRFETQEADEEVILFLRQHIITLLPKVIIGILLLIGPFVIFPFLMRFLQTPIVIPSGYVIVGTVFWYVATFGLLLSQFLYWYFNIFIVTNQRIIDIDFLYLLYKKMSEAQVSRIQDISYRSGGIMATMFDYGDVHIQTAGSLPNFVFECVPKPGDVVEVISDVSKVKIRKAKL